MSYATATSILRARLANTSRIDVSIIDPVEAQNMPNYNNVDGRMFCFFAMSVNRAPILLVFGREGDSTNISHVFAFYVNTKYKIIQPKDRDKFKCKLGQGVRLGLDVKLGVVNAPTEVPSQ